MSDCNIKYIEKEYSENSDYYKALHNMHYIIKDTLKKSKGIYEKNGDLYAHKYQNEYAIAVTDIGKLNKPIMQKYNTDAKVATIEPFTRKIIINVLPFKEQIFKKYGLVQESVFASDALPAKGNKYYHLEDKVKFALHAAYSEKAKLEKSLQDATSKDSKKDISLKLNAINKRIENLNTKKEKVQKLNSVDEIKSILEEDVQDIKDILNKKQISNDELQYLQNTLNFWKKVLDFSDLNEVDELGIFDRSDITSDKFMNGYTNVTTGERIKGINESKLELESLNAKLTDIQQHLVEAIAKEHGNKNWTLKDLFAKISDISSITSNLLDISRYNVPLVSTLFNLTKKANFRGYQEAREELSDIDELDKKASPKLKRYEKNGDKYYLFKQKNSKGEETGRFVFRYLQDFFDEKKKVLSKAKGIKTKKAWKDFNKWKAQNELVFDVRKLFPTKQGDSYHYTNETFTTEDINVHKKELKDLLGEKDYNKYISWIQDKVDQFIFAYEQKKEELELDNDLDSTEKDRLLEIWDRENSPYYYSRIVSDGSVIEFDGKFINNKGYNYTKSIPKLSKWYDPNYKIIQSDEDIANLYDKFMDILDDIHNILPEHELKNVSVSTIPLMKKSILEQLTTNGMGMGLTEATYDAIVNSITTNDSNEISNINRDILTGKAHRQIRNNIFQDHNLAIKKVIEVKKLEYKVNNGKDPSYELIKSWRESAIDAYIKKETSTDLLKTMKVASVKSFTYKQRALVEDNVKLLETTINSLKQAETNGAGNILKDKALNTIVNDKGLNNLKSSVEYFLDSFYNNPLHKKELISSKKKLTTEELKLKSKLDEIENNDKASDEDKIKAKEIKDTLGSNINRASYIDGAIKYTYLKLLGWNIPSALANVGIGQISNYIEASAGRYFNTNQLNKAFLLIKSNTKNIEKLAVHFDVLKESYNEIVEERRMQSAGKLRLLSPMELQRRGEWLNQVPVFIAMMQNEKIGESNLYELLKEGDLNQVDKDVIERFKIKVDAVIKKIHGNYDPESLVRAKSSVYGRALLQFRSFMAEAAANRFESEKYDAALGMTRKGRYRSYSTFGNVDGVLFILKQLTRKLMRQSTEFDSLIGENFTELDAANMRANMSELVVLMSITFMMLALSAGGSDDDKKKKRNFAINLVMNQGLRLQNDILMFSNPMTIDQVSKNILPVASNLSDINKWFHDSFKFIEGDDALKTGLHKGDSRFFRSTIKMLPAGNAALKLESNIEQNYNEMQSR